MRRGKRGPPHSAAFKAKFARLWADPTMSCVAIAAQLGVSKCAVTGLRSRMGLPSRGSPIRPATPGEQSRKVVRELLAPPGSPRPRQLAVPTVRFSSCQFLLSDGPPWRFCDAPVEQERAAYCGKHQQRCRGHMVALKVPELRRYP
jgi:hypothetical protein